MATSNRHYHVIENTPGYLPDGDGSLPTFTNRRDAVAYGTSLARELREEGYRVWGSQSEGSWYGEHDSSDLGRSIVVSECTESDCASE